MAPGLLMPASRSVGVNRPRSAIGSFEGDRKGMQLSTEETRNAPAASKPTVRRVRIEDILAGHREVIIEHGSEEYRLRLTSNSKLILTK